MPTWWSLINSRNKRCPCFHRGRGSEPEGFATAHQQGAHEPEDRVVEADINIATLCFWLFLVSLHSTLSFEMRTLMDFFTPTTGQRCGNKSGQRREGTQIRK